MAFDPNEGLERRIARLEALAALSFLDPEMEADATRYYIARLLHTRDDSRTSRDFGRIIEELAFRRRHPTKERLLEEISSLSDQQSKIQQSTRSTSIRLQEMKTTLESLLAEQRELRATTHEWLVAHSFGFDTSKMRLTRFVPLRVYLSDGLDNTTANVSAAVNELLTSFGFSVADDFPPVIGSWFKKWLTKTKDAVKQPEVAERLSKLERAVELQGLGKPQADIDAKQAAAISQLIKSVKDVPNVAVQVGSILFVKATINGNPVIQARTLTQAELMQLENNQELLTSPRDLLDRLSDMCRSDSRNKVAETKGLSSEKTARKLARNGSTEELPGKAILRYRPGSPNIETSKSEDQNPRDEPKQLPAPPTPRGADRS